MSIAESADKEVEERNDRGSGGDTLYQRVLVYSS
jgi:hypothetical protein